MKLLKFHKAYNFFNNYFIDSKLIENTYKYVDFSLIVTLKFNYEFTQETVNYSLQEIKEEILEVAKTDNILLVLEDFETSFTIDDFDTQTPYRLVISNSKYFPTLNMDIEPGK